MYTPTTKPNGGKQKIKGKYNFTSNDDGTAFSIFFF